MFAQDRDLLIHEPTLFDTVGFAAQRLVGPVTASIAAGSTLLDLDAGDMETPDVGPGEVVALSGLGTVEVVSRVTFQALAVSRLRADVNAAAVAPSESAWSGEATVWTFAPQIALVHRSLLAAMGIEEGEAPGEGAEPTGGGHGPVFYASQLVDTHPWRHAEALGALHLVYAAASVNKTTDDPLWHAAERYRVAFAGARETLKARIDTDGDGEAELIRSMNTHQLTRG